MQTPRTIAWMFPLLLLTAAPCALAQAYPDKPIRIVTAEAGGGADVAARMLAQGITGGLGQQVIVENRPGNGMIPGQQVAKAPPDGYTLLLYGSAIWLLPYLEDNAPWDTMRDFAPISLVTRTPNIVVVTPGLPVNSVSELIALAKAKPGELNYGSPGAGGAFHLATELFKAMAGVDIVHVPYKGTGPALNDLIAGRIQVIFSSTVSAMPHVKSGRLRALAVTTAQPSPLAPGLPTVSASGVPGYEAASMQGAWAPARTPAAVIARLNREIVQFLSKPEVTERLLSTGVEAVPTTPEQFAAALRTEMAKWGKLIKDVGIRAN